MKKRFILLISVCFIIPLPAFTSGIEDNVLFSDDFSDPASWQAQGSGAVYVGNGACNLDHVFCGDYNRVFKSVGIGLPVGYWRAECEFSILGANPVGYGTGEVVMALTAGDLDFMSYNAAQGYEETNQDGIAVVLLSNSSSDNDINNWYFMIEAKKGTERTYDTAAVIHAISGQTLYYVRLEKIGEDLAQLNVCYDPDFMVPLPGSPVTFSINPAIYRLTTIQHGTITPGFFSRLVNASVDNVVIYDQFPQNQFMHTNLLVKNELQVFPVPASSSIGFHVEDENAFPAVCEYRILDLKGSVLAADRVDALGRIDVSGLIRGVFILMVNGTEKTFRAKFQKID